MQASVQAEQRSGGLAYKWVVAAVVVIGVFMSILDQTIVNIAIPRLQTAFGADVHSVQWVLTAYILTQGVVTPTSAYFADRFGIKRFYIISLTMFTLCSALCGLAWNLPMLIFFRILQGAGGAALFPLSTTWLFREFPPQERGMASGVFGIPALLAPAVGPTLGGYLVTFVGWQAIFYINLPIGIIAVILVITLLRESRLEAGLRFDFLGFFLVAVGLALLLYSLSDASTDGWASIQVLGTLTVGLLFLAGFVVFELYAARRERPVLLDLRLFTNFPFSASIFASLFVIFGLFGGLFLLPIYLQELRGLSAFQAGLVLLPQAFASMVTVIIGGRLVDRLGARAVTIPGLIILIFATWQLSYITIYSPYWWLQSMLIIRGLGLGLCIQPLTVIGLSEIRLRQLGQASALNTVARAVSSSLGIAVLATLVQTQQKLHYGHLAEQVTPSSQLGRLIPQLQAYFVAHGGDINQARLAAIQLVSGLLQRQAYVLAIQNAFQFTIAVLFLAILAVAIVRKTRTKSSGQAAPGDVPAEDEEAVERRHMVMAE